MKTIFYVIHNTHSIRHIDNSMRSFKQQDNKLGWEKLVIKNSITDQIPNNTVNEIIEKYKLTSIFSSIEFIEAGPVNTTYSDLKDAVAFGQKNKADFLLFTKAEYCFSIGSFNFFKKLFSQTDNADWVLTLPVVNATELANEQLIDKYLNHKQFIKEDAVTGYDGDDQHRVVTTNSNGVVNKILYKFNLKKRPANAGDIANRKIDETKTYQLIAHNVVLDINVHLFGKTALAKMDFNNDELNLQWGRIRALDRLLEKGTKFILTKKCFVIHLFHEIPGARLGRNIKGIRY